MYLPSNDATANAVHHALEIHFESHAFLYMNISKTVRSTGKCSSTTLIEADICYRMGP